MSKRFWIAKDLWGGLQVFNKEPLMDKDGDYGYRGPRNIKELCGDGEEIFEEITGIRIKEGEFVQVEVKEVTDRFTYSVEEVRAELGVDEI